MNDDNKTHHPFGPSRWPGLYVCPGYMPSGGGDFAERGTAVHKALDTGDFSKLREDDRETALWMAETAQRMTEGIENVVSETRVCIPEDDKIPEVLWGITGTCDRAWTTEDGSLHVADYKAFSKIGLTDYRPQTCGYALGLKRPANGCYVFHVFHGGSRQVETSELTESDVLGFAAVVAFAIENPTAARCRSAHCDHCARSGDCPESAKVVAFGSLAAGRITKELVKANPAEAARLCDWLDAAAKRIEQAREIIADAAKEGAKIEDPATGVRYEVQRRAGRAQVPPVAEILPRLTGEDGVSERDVLLRATLSLTNLRDLVGNARAEEYAVRGEDTLCFVRKSGNKEGQTRGLSRFI